MRPKKETAPKKRGYFFLLTAGFDWPQIMAASLCLRDAALLWT
jgi:hypothetical protein